MKPESEVDSKVNNPCFCQNDAFLLENRQLHDSIMAGLDHRSPPKLVQEEPQAHVRRWNPKVKQLELMDPMTVSFFYIGFDGWG